MHADLSASPRITFARTGITRFRTDFLDCDARLIASVHSPTIAASKSSPLRSTLAPSLTRISITTPPEAISHVPKGLHIEYERLEAGDYRFCIKPDDAAPLASIVSSRTKKEATLTVGSETFFFAARRSIYFVDWLLHASTDATSTTHSTPLGTITQLRRFTIVRRSFALHLPPTISDEARILLTFVMLNREFR
jgi:hypothetical protein